MTVLENINPSLRLELDVVAVFVAIGGIFEVLPPIATVLSIIWLGMQVYGWLVNRKWRRTPNG